MPFFDFGSIELLLIAVIALIVVGPKDLPKLMRAVGKGMAKVRGAARHFKSGVDEMMRQAEMEEMQAKWEAHNRAVMRETPKADAPEADTLSKAPSDAPAGMPSPKQDEAPASGSSGRS